jgi:hypothetical protein
MLHGDTQESDSEQNLQDVDTDHKEGPVLAMNLYVSTTRSITGSCKKGWDIGESHHLDTDLDLNIFFEGSKYNENQHARIDIYILLVFIKYKI